MSNCISNSKHHLVKHLVKLRDDRDYRYKMREFLLEGKKSIRDIWKKFTPKYIFSTNAKEALILQHHRSQDSNTRFQLVSSAILHKIADSQHPENVLAVFPFPHWVQDHSSSKNKKMHRILEDNQVPSIDLKASVLDGKKYLLALDSVQDPGNVGTLFRTALILGWEGIFLVGLENYSPPLVTS